MRLIFNILLFNLLWPLILFSQESSLEETSLQLIAQLNHENSTVRAWAKEQLMQILQTAIPLLLKEYPQLNYRGRREAVDLIAQNKTPETPDRLIACLQDSDYGVRNRAILALLDMVDSDPKILPKIKELKSPIPEVQASIQSFIQTYAYKKVEAELEQLISPSGGFGSYEGQFDGMKYLGADAIDPLMAIFASNDYQFVHIRLQQNDEARYKIRYLAGEAFPTFAPYMNGKKQDVLLLLKQVAFSVDRAESQLAEIAKTSLYFLGETHWLDREIEAWLDRIQENPFDAESCAELGLLYLRIRKEENGVKLLKRAVALAPNYAHAHYNLACAYACLGKVNEALDSLETAVSNGYDDVNWILKDGDLRILRNQPRFLKVVEHLQNKFAANPANIGGK